MKGGGVKVPRRNPVHIRAARPSSLPASPPSVPTSVVLVPAPTEDPAAEARVAELLSRLLWPADRR